MLQVGCASAASTVTSASCSALRPRNGPPLAVSRRRSTSRSAATDERRHWCSAQCSLSTGTSSAPGTSRSGCTTGPAAIRLSLLARARRLPERSVSIVTARPANPTTPLTTTSAGSATRARSATTSTPGKRRRDLATGGFIGHRHQRRRATPRLLDHGSGRTPHRQRHDLVRAGHAGILGLDDLDRLGADRSGRPGDRHAGRRRHQLLRAPSRVRPRASGSTPRAARTGTRRNGPARHRGPG